MGIRIQSSEDDFRMLRKSGAYYVDKTDLIAEYLDQHFERAVLFARPRRFGKTLTMTMFRDFLDIRQNSREIFSGLRIMEHSDVVAEYMNQYPVIFLSLKEISGRTMENVLQKLRIEVSKVCEQHRYLMESPEVSQARKTQFDKLINQAASQDNTEQALDLIAQMLNAHFGKPAFVIIDEYDVPIAKAYGTEFYEQVRDMIEQILSYVCKTNSSVKAVILSGYLFTVKNSTYTGVNNIKPYTVLSPLYASCIGFTDENVQRLLMDAGIPESYDITAEWYDGYYFGRDRMYCPWDVLSFVQSKLDGSYSDKMGPESYWVNTSFTTQNLIHGFFGKTSEVNERFEELLAGKTIECVINEHVPYHEIHENGENLWSALLETGYLTKAIPEKMQIMPLRIPNREIQDVFRREVWQYFKTKVDNGFVSDLVSSLWAGEINKAEAVLCQILEATISFYHEYHEYSYHLILDGFFTGIGYRVQSERETGYGRSDLIVLDPGRNRSMILELKHVQAESEMNTALKEAASQIIQKKYESVLRYEGYTTRLKYAMAFYDKRARIRDSSFVG
ncbi:MAG: AAA family ATPase [Clostridia bacterium]|nr:AAA family ATPase [Clostridia bacterium]